jgi:hypothetical protein
VKIRFFITLFVLLMLLSCRAQRTPESGGQDSGIEATVNTQTETSPDTKTAMKEDYTKALLVWTHAASYPFNEDSIDIITYGNGRFIAAGGHQIWLAYSDDGDRWHTVQNDVFRSRVEGLAYGKGRFVAALRGNKMAYSDDGVTWTLAENGGLGNYTIYGISYGDGCFVAVGYNDHQKNGIIGYSDNGETWTLVEDGSLDIQSFYCITYGNGMFIAGGANGGAAYSNDGITWTAIHGSPFGDVDIFILGFGNGRFVGYGSHFQGYDPMTLYSDNGIDWSAIENFPFNIPHNIVYANGIFIAVSNRASMSYSFDGEIWYPDSRGGFTINALAGNLGGIAYGNGRFVIGCGNGVRNSSKIAWCDVPVGTQK